MVIESRLGKVAIVSGLLLLAALLVARAPHHKRRAFYVVSGGLVLVATYIALRVKTPLAPRLTSIIGDVDAFMADHSKHVETFEAWATGKRIRREPPETLLEDLWKYRNELLGPRFQELFPAVLAAYGDSFVRHRPGAQWLKVESRLAVGVPRRPWTYQRLEVDLYNWLDAGV